MYFTFAITGEAAISRARFCIHHETPFIFFKGSICFKRMVYTNGCQRFSFLGIYFFPFCSGVNNLVEFNSPTRAMCRQAMLI